MRPHKALLRDHPAMRSVVCMPINRSSLTFLATLAIALGVVAWVIHRSDQRSAAGVETIGWQHADVPPDDREGPPDPRLDPPDAWLDAASPIVDGIGPAFLGQPAPGEEVLAAADGVVLFAGARDGILEIRLGHRDDAGFRFESIYSPLAITTVQPGQVVGRGMPIGRMEDGEMAAVLPILPPGIARFDGGQSALAAALAAPDPDPWMWLEMENVDRFLDLMGPVED